MENQSAKWVAGLNNGEIAVEGIGKWEIKPGELSPWNRLKHYLKENKLNITSLQIKNRANTYNLPSNNPKFGGMIPKDYNYFRKVIGEIGISGLNFETKHICIEAIYDSFKVRLWVDDSDRHGSWITIESNDK